jgi:sialidase-1
LVINQLEIIKSNIMNKKIQKSLIGISLLMLIACAKQQPLEEKLAIDSKLKANAEGQALAAAQVHEQAKIFDGGTGGYHSFRIPSLIRTTNGTLIAFAEGRMSDNKDYGNINVVFKRSTNNGTTWSAMGEVVGVGPGTWGNPTAVVDQSNGRVWLFMSWNDDQHNQSGTDGYQPINSWGERKVYASHSDDEGATWSSPLDLTATLLPSGYTWDAMGPGVGIQKNKTGATGRLIIPAIGRNIYSDDHGQTWSYQTLPSGTSEGTVIEKLNGGLIRNDRPVGSQWELSKRRRISVGSISAFPAWVSDDELLDPACQASVLRYTDSPNRIMFLNSASTETRGKMRVRITYNEGSSWPISRRIFDNLTEQKAIDQGKGGYSSMAKTADNMVGALIEINENTASSSTSNRSIEFHKFNLPWILNGAAEPQ